MNEKIPIQEYTPIIAHVKNSKIISSEYPHVIGTTLHIEDTKDKITEVDLGQLNLDRFNTTIRRWNNKVGDKNPTIPCSFRDQLKREIHPIAYVKTEDKEHIDILLDTLLNNTTKILPIDVLDKYSNIYIKRFTQFDKDNNIKIETPKISEEAKEKLLNTALNNVLNKHKIDEDSIDSYNITIPNKIEFEDNSEMIDKVYNKCKYIPEFKITYLRKVKLLFRCFTGTTSQQKHILYSIGQILGLKDKIDIGTRKPIYIGEAWNLCFTINNKNYMKSSGLFFITQEQLYKAREDLKGLHKGLHIGMYGITDWIINCKPWAELMYLSSEWCQEERDGNSIRLPITNAQSLESWLINYFPMGVIRKGGKDPFKNIEGYTFNKTKATPKLLEYIKKHRENK